MDKNNIKNRLTQRFLSEENTPGIKVTADMNKKSGVINKKGVGAEAKDAIDYNKSLKQDSDTSKMADNKFNYTDDYEKTYHDEMEIMNGQEMIQYDRKPNQIFQEKAEEAIAGSSRMGNNPEWANVVDKQQGFEGPDFGKNLVKKIKASEEKRSEQTPTLNLRGANIQADMKDTGHRPYAFEKSVKENNNNNNKPQIKESMKRLKFKKEFNGVGNALKMIPESYKVDAKEFEMTDGNETYRIRWEGTLSEGAAVVITANDKKMVNEDIQRMKALFGYKSQDTLGLVKGNARIDENKVFGDIWNKSKRLLGESEEIEGQTADKTAPFEEAGVKQAADAKKHIQGSASTDKGTTASKPKTGNWEDNVKGQAAEAKKHVEGSVSTDKGTKAPKAKEGEWDEIENSAPEATEHMESGQSTNKATNKAKVVAPAKAVNENIGEEEEEKETPEHEAGESKEYEAGEEESGEEESGEEGSEEVAPAKTPSQNSGADTILYSASADEYWIQSPSIPTGRMKVPDQYISIASDKSKKAAQRAEMILDMMSNEEEELDGLNEGFSPEMEAAAETQFDEMNAKLGGKETANKMKWLERAKSNNFKGTFKLQKGRNGTMLMYDTKEWMPDTGSTSYSK